MKYGVARKELGGFVGYTPHNGFFASRHLSGSGACAIGEKVILSEEWSRGRRTERAGIRQLSGPIVVGYQVTNRCNLSCCYCYADNIVSREPIRSTEAVELARCLVAFNPLCVSISGGEPSLVLNLGDILNIFLNNNIFVAVDTNGGDTADTLDPELFRAPGASLRVSLDSTNNEVNRALRGDVQGPISTIERMVDAGVDVTVNTVLSNQSIDNIEQTAMDLADMGVGTWNLFVLVTEGLSSGLCELIQYPGNLDRQSVFEMLPSNCPAHVYVIDGGTPRSMCMVDHGGAVYTIGEEGREEYGNIRDVGIGNIWSKPVVDQQAHLEKYLGVSR